MANDIAFDVCPKIQQIFPQKYSTEKFLLILIYFDFKYFFCEILKKSENNIFRENLRGIRVVKWART